MMGRRFWAHVHHDGTYKRFTSKRSLISFLERTRGRHDTLSITLKEPGYRGYTNVVYDNVPGEGWRYVVYGTELDPRIASRRGIVNPSWHIAEYETLDEVIQFIKR